MKRILIADDSPALRALIAAALAGAEEIQAEGVASGLEAIKFLSANDDCQLVLADINMPDISGLELVRFIKTNERLRHIPVCVISTDTTDQDRQRALALGADDYLAKPFTAEQLHQIISKHLTRKS